MYRSANSHATGINVEGVSHSINLFNIVACKTRRNSFYNGYSVIDGVLN